MMVKCVCVWLVCVMHCRNKESWFLFGMVTLFVCLSVSLSLSHSLGLSLTLSVLSLSVCLSLSLSVCLSVSFCLSLFVYLSVCLSLFIPPSLHPSLSPFLLSPSLRLSPPGLPSLSPSLPLAVVHLQSSNHHLARHACSSLGEIVRSSVLPLPSTAIEGESSKVLSKLSVVEALRKVLKNTSDAQVQSQLLWKPLS